MAHHGHDTYTMEQAIKEAHRLLAHEFGDAQQEAAVSLATFLYSVHAREEFLRGEQDEMPYGGAPR